MWKACPTSGEQTNTSRDAHTKTSRLVKQPPFRIQPKIVYIYASSTGVACREHPPTQVQGPVCPEDSIAPPCAPLHPSATFVLTFRTLEKSRFGTLDLIILHACRPLHYCSTLPPPRAPLQVHQRSAEALPAPSLRPAAHPDDHEPRLRRVRERAALPQPGGASGRLVHDGHQTARLLPKRQRF